MSTRKIIPTFARLLLIPLMASFFFTPLAFAHGEKAQQAGLRMRTINWIDLDISTDSVAVNGIVKVNGTFIPSEHWPRHMDSIEETAFLNIGVPGPAFVRLHSKVNGTTMIRSTSFELGKIYHYEVTLKARSPGRYHMHPLINVRGTGPLIGPGLWVEVTGDQADFENTVKTLTGEVINLETYGLKTALWFHAFWIVMGLIWIGYWFRNARKEPVIMNRFNAIERLGSENADSLITQKDMIFGGVSITAVLVIVAVGYFVANHFYPQSIPLQTGWVKVKPIDNPSDKLIDIEVLEANYRIPGRSFSLRFNITNNTDKALIIGELTTANIRFINSDYKQVALKDSHDLVAQDGLRLDTDLILPGQTTTVMLHAEDALWETQRLTSLIYDPDSLFAGVLFMYDEDGNRWLKEVSGLIIPTFT
ncbi:MAG: methane monooxygenase/ammonia monooxygenase subunit B [Moraxellaceae bacterium]|nr:MAG: methane monooxygenase/ammonia monooxygenase subunit B [Moraxellaceae bacterium]